MTNFEKFLNEKELVIFPGPVGTELQRRGYKTKLPLWSASANEDALPLVQEIQEDYFRAGADINITNTFRTTPRIYKKIGRENDARQAMRNAVQAARNAQAVVTDRPTFIGGSFAPLEDCYSPDLVPDIAALEAEHGQLAQWLAEDGVDFLIPETINAVAEAKVMAKAASDTGLPFIICFLVDSEAKLLDGTPIENVLQETDFPGRVGVGLNCRPIDVIDGAYRKVLENYDESVAIYPNGFGCPHDDLGWLFEENDDSTRKFVDVARRWKAQGVKIIGGCCGMTPAYIQALAESVVN